MVKLRKKIRMNDFLSIIGASLIPVDARSAFTLILKIGQFFTKLSQNLRGKVNSNGQ